MVKIINRTNGKEAGFAVEDKLSVLKFLYGPLANDFLDISNEMKKAIETYKNVPLTRYKLRGWQQTGLSNGTITEDDIPRYEVKGFDTLVCSAKFDRQLKNEFYLRLLEGDRRVVDFINHRNKKYIVKVVEEN